MLLSDNVSVAAIKNKKHKFLPDLVERQGPASRSQSVQGRVGSHAHLAQEFLVNACQRPSGEIIISGKVCEREIGRVDKASRVSSSRIPAGVATSWTTE